MLQSPRGFVSTHLQQTRCVLHCSVVCQVFGVSRSKSGTHSVSLSDILYCPPDDLMNTRSRFFYYVVLVSLTTMFRNTYTMEDLDKIFPHINGYGHNTCYICVDMCAVLIVCVFVHMCVFTCVYV